MENKFRVIKLTSGDLIIGNTEAIDEHNFSVENPYTIIDLGTGPCVAPYMIDKLIEPMEQISLRLYDVMWSKNLDDFPVVKEQYIAATTGIELSTKENIIL